MIEKYYSGVIEQIYNRIGKETRNIVMANYSNDFSIENLEVIRRYQSNEDNVFFAYSEFSYNTLVGAYEPFLDIICNMHRRFIGGSFDDFQRECGVYYLHRQVLNSYYETGECFREETVLLNEVAYEQRRMTMAIADMLKKLSEVRPLMIVINRFQMASKSSIETIKYLIDNPMRYWHRREKAETRNSRLPQVRGYDSPTEHPHTRPAPAGILPAHKHLHTYRRIHLYQQRTFPFP
jgi:hypothetical protein